MDGVSLVGGKSLSHMGLVSAPMLVRIHGRRNARGQRRRSMRTLGNLRGFFFFLHTNFFSFFLTFPSHLTGHADALD